MSLDGGKTKQISVQKLHIKKKMNVTKCMMQARAFSTTKSDRADQASWTDKTFLWFMCCLDSGIGVGEDT